MPTPAPTIHGLLTPDCMTPDGIVPEPGAVPAAGGTTGGAPAPDATCVLPDGSTTVAASGVLVAAGTAIWGELESRRNRFRSAPRSAAVW